MEEKLFKVGEEVPKAGKYQCIVCDLIVEFLPKHIEQGVLFLSCPLCFAGTDEGPKKPDEDVWKYVG